MHWPPDFADDLPAPRDDEPMSLRQDIADELADHLQCAFTRELHTTRDEQAARAKALGRFGDPRAVACKLWFDALRDKIMSQRLTFVALAVVLLASLGSTAATWFVVEQARRANETMLTGAREANEALLAESRETNAALLAKLSELSTSNSAEPKSLEWNPVKVRLYSGEKPGAPAAGFKVTLSGHVLDTSKSVTITRTTDAKGVADFGLVRPGEHSINVSAPWKEGVYSIPLYVLPGNPVLEEVQCPAADLPVTDVRFEIDWPEDLKGRGFWVLGQFTEKKRVVGERTWTKSTSSSEHFLLLDADFQIIPFPFSAQSLRNARQTLPPWPFEQTHNMPFDVRGLRAYSRFTQIGGWSWKPEVVERRRAAQATGRPVSEPFEFVFQDTASVSQTRVAADEYRLEAILVGESPQEFSMESAWMLTSSGQQEAIKRQQQTQARQANPPDALQVRLDSFVPESRGNLKAMKILGGLLPGAFDVRNPLIGIPDGYRPLADWVAPMGMNQQKAEAELRASIQPHFVAEAGKQNVWKITLPKSLLEKVRGNPDFKDAEGDSKEAAPVEKENTEKSADGA